MSLKEKSPSFHGNWTVARGISDISNGPDNYNIPQEYSSFAVYDGTSVKKKNKKGNCMVDSENNHINKIHRGISLQSKDDEQIIHVNNKTKEYGYLVMSLACFIITILMIIIIIINISEFKLYYLFPFCFVLGFSLLTFWISRTSMAKTPVKIILDMEKIQYYYCNKKRYVAKWNEIEIIYSNFSPYTTFIMLKDLTLYQIGDMNKWEKPIVFNLIYRYIKFNSIRVKIEDNNSWLNRDYLSGKLSLE